MSKKKLFLGVLAVLVVAAVVVFATSSEYFQGRMFKLRGVTRLTPKVGTVCTNTGTPDLAPSIVFKRVEGPLTETNGVEYEVSYYLANLSNVNVTNQPIHYTYSAHDGIWDTYTAEASTKVSVNCKSRTLVKKEALYFQDSMDEPAHEVNFTVDSQGEVAETNEDNNHTSRTIIVKTVDYGPGEGSTVNSETGAKYLKLNWTNLYPATQVKEYNHYIYSGELPYTYGPILSWDEHVYTTEAGDNIYYNVYDPAPHANEVGQWIKTTTCGKTCNGVVVAGPELSRWGILEYVFNNGDKSYSNVYKIEAEEVDEPEIFVDAPAQGGVISGGEQTLGQFIVTASNDVNGEAKLEDINLFFESENMVACDLYMYAMDNPEYIYAPDSYFNFGADFDLSSNPAGVLAPGQSRTYVLKGTVASSANNSFFLTRVEHISWNDNAGDYEWYGFDDEVVMGPLMLNTTVPGDVDNFCKGDLDGFDVELTRCKLLKQIAGRGYYGVYPFTPDVATFLDVPMSSECFSIVEGAVDYGWINGYPDGSFDPDGLVNKAEASKVIYGVRNPENFAPSDSETFNDVGLDDWFFDFVDYLVQSGALGDEAGQAYFHPSNTALVNWSNAILDFFTNLDISGPAPFTGE